MEEIQIIREFVHKKRIRFKKHAFTRLVERRIKIAEVEEALSGCKIIDSYPDDTPLKSYLLLGYSKSGDPLHIVLAIDRLEKILWIITVYKPDMNKWNPSFTKRK